jgi:muramoyltetrapeptide carboxypeptidase
VGRGGYGATRIVSRLPWKDLNPRWIVGFSDTTALHVRALKHGHACIHGPHVTGLGASSSDHLAQNRGAWLAALEHPTVARSWNGLHVLRGGTARGPLFGGNLALMCAMATMNALVVPDGAIVLLEDVTEHPYRVDRMLTSLLEGGHLTRASALVFGTFEQCAPRADGVSIEDVLLDRTASLRIPVLTKAPFGHGTHNEAFTLGAIAELAGKSLTWPMN